MRNQRKILLGAATAIVGIIVVAVFISRTSQLVKKTTEQLHEVPPTDMVATKHALPTCPAGFILIPGDPSLHTTDFCVMKYGAKCANKSDLTTGLQPAHNTACSGQGGGLYYGTYRNSGAGCACKGDKQLVSTATGFPVAYIPEAAAPANKNTPDNAIAYCQAQGWHLITNPEWMTIARNVEKIPENWCNKDGSQCGFPPGTPGKILVNGHNDGENEASASASRDGALIATDDAHPCFGTTTDGSNACGGASSQKRTLTLSNGQVIWDLAGNTWSWIDATVLRKDQPQSTTNGVLDHGWKWSEFNQGGLKKTIITSNGTGPALGYDAFRPSHDAYTATQGVGRIYHYSVAKDTNTTAYTFIRGGTWEHGYDSGAFSIHLSPTADVMNINDVSFRCVTSSL